jgi:TRAP-type C4-dicarboxylate transport system permease small subunit
VSVKKQGKLWPGLIKLIHVLIIILLAAMVIVVPVGVFARYVLNSAISWGEEFSRYCMIWLAMLGGMVALLDNAHVGVSVFVDLFPAKIKHGILQFGRIFIVLFLVVVFGYSIVHLIGVQGQASSALEIPMFIPYMAITAGTFLMLLVAIRQLFGLEKVKTTDEATLDEVADGSLTCEATMEIEKAKGGS